METETRPRSVEQIWPALPWDAWKDTCDTLHRWTQIVGKAKLELSPFLNEWWEVGFHVTARGLTTGIIPVDDRVFQVDFDLVDHNLRIATSNNQIKTMPLMPRSVADFYQELMSVLKTLGIDVAINTKPVEIDVTTPFEQDQEHASYDAEYVHRWWRILVQTNRVLQRYRAPFVGNSSPVLFYWGSFDLNTTRFSGRPAPQPPSGPRFYQLAEDQENVACGCWPGNPNASGIGLGQPAFYSYTYPAPQGIQNASVQPGAAYWDSRLGEFILRYEDARTSDDPAQAILDFFQSAYEAGATLAGWDRSLLEHEPPEVGGHQY